jgi:hypothetical protein
MIVDVMKTYRVTITCNSELGEYNELVLIFPKKRVQSFHSSVVNLCNLSNYKLLDHHAPLEFNFNN